MTEVIRSDGIEIKKKVIQQILLRGSGDSKFNNHINKSLKLLPPSDNLRIISGYLRQFKIFKGYLRQFKDHVRLFKAM